MSPRYWTPLAMRVGKKAMSPRRPLLTWASRSDWRTLFGASAVVSPMQVVTAAALRPSWVMTPVAQAALYVFFFMLHVLPTCWMKDHHSQGVWAAAATRYTHKLRRFSRMTSLPVYPAPRSPSGSSWQYRPLLTHWAAQKGMVGSAAPQERVM